MATKRTFTKTQMADWHMPYKAPPGGRIVSDEIVGTRRWSVDHEIIFTIADSEPGTAWCAYYSVGATESQDEGPWEYDDEIEATLVYAVEKTVTVWEPVP